MDRRKERRYRRRPPHGPTLKTTKPWKSEAKELEAREAMKRRQRQFVIELAVHLSSTFLVGVSLWALLRLISLYSSKLLILTNPSLALIFNKVQYLVGHLVVAIVVVAAIVNVILFFRANKRAQEEERNKESSL